MPSKEVLDEAVAKGIIAPEQADALLNLELTSLQSPKLPLKADLDAEDDEGFRFISGFNDIFLSLGVIMVLYGLSLSQLSTGPMGHALTVVILWGLGEVFAGWLKRTLPSMIVAAAFNYHVLAIASIYILDRELAGINVFANWPSHISVLPMFGVGIIASLIFYARFKLPFALFLTGLQMIGMVVFEASDVLNQQTIGYIIPLLFLAGLALFVLAMWFDVADRLRQTRLSDNAFWLHLLASPLIVHSIMWQSAIWTLGYDQTNSLRELENIAPLLAVLVLSIFVVLMIVALIIDRRAMLVSSLVYVSVAVTYFLTRDGISLGTASITPVLIGSVIIALGVGWRAMRQLIFTILPLGYIETRLPPLRS